jgi:hypothetical protein
MRLKYLIYNFNVAYHHIYYSLCQYFHCALSRYYDCTGCHLYLKMISFIRPPFTYSRQKIQPLIATTKLMPWWFWWFDDALITYTQSQTMRSLYQAFITRYFIYYDTWRISRDFYIYWRHVLFLLIQTYDSRLLTSTIMCQILLDYR